MSQYKVVVALWEDHTVFREAELPNKLEEAIIPSLTTGILYKETDRYVVIVSHIERFENHDESDYTIILKGSILSMKEFGEVEIKKLRYHKEGRK